MKLKKCDRGHFYDEEKFGGCPHCHSGIVENSKIFEMGFPERFRNLGVITEIKKKSMNSVYKISGSKCYVVKVISCEKHNRKYNDARKEIKIMQALKGMRSAVQILDTEIVVNEKGRTVFILEEYLESFSSYISRQDNVDMAFIVEIMCSICRAAIDCKKCGIFHLDIHPDNLFFRKGEDQIVFGDFGSSLFMEELTQNAKMRGSLAFMAPEVYRLGKCSEQSEIYTIGLIFYYLLNERHLPFMQQDEEEVAVYKRLAGTPVPLLEQYDEYEFQAILCMIDQAYAYNVEERYDSLEALLYTLEYVLKRLHLGDIQNPKIELGYAHPPIPQQNEDMLLIEAFEEEEGTLRDFENVTVPYYIEEIPCPSPAPCNPVFSAREFSCSMPETEDTDGKKLEISKVHFSAIAPKTFLRDEYTLIDVVMYEDSFRSIVDEILKESEVPVRETKSGIIKIQGNAKVRIKLFSPDIELEDTEEEGEWQGEYLNFRFAVMLLESYEKAQILFQATVYIDDVIATRLKFVARCSSADIQKMEVTKKDILSAFVSYASQDRQNVARIIMGMKKVRPDMDIFFDVESLRSGEEWPDVLKTEILKRDTLFLCWSSYAKQSKWVDKEWRYAYEQKGKECIEPIPLEPPVNCLPPAELEGKHFNDRLLYIILAS